ncbi:hypothetical protein GF366_03260 [Candidatus Peregrinibacteria bacterium]|nr:hypothetical protein [Candidatus Peregrinibacteria bacterium]
MSLESFIGREGDEGMSEAAFEAFKEKMKKAAAQIAAIKKEEGKQKKKEEELLKILLKFVKNSQKKELVLLISRVLEQNIPANFVLAIILLGNEDIQREVGKFLMLESPEEKPEAKAGEKDLIFFKQEDESLPLKVRIEIDEWIKSLFFQAEENPQKIIKNAYKTEIIEEPEYKEKKILKTPLIQLTTFVIRDFLEQNKISEPYSKLKNFASFILKGILSKTQENLEKRKLIADKAL